jgi:serine/threonine protein kinase
MQPPPVAVVSLTNGRRYDLIRKLSDGWRQGNADTWVARDADSGGEVAIKIATWGIDSKLWPKTLDGLTRLQSVRHPHLIESLDCFFAAHPWPHITDFLPGTSLHVVTELAEDSLRQRLERCVSSGMQGVPVSELTRLFEEAAEAIDFLHANSILHGNVTLDNVLILNDHAKVSDAGFQTMRQDTWSLCESFSCKVRYAHLPDGEDNPTADQNSLALSYIEARQGVPPIPAVGNSVLVMFAIMEGKFEILSIMGEFEQAVLRKALSKEPAERFPNCREFVEALAEATGQARK